MKKVAAKGFVSVFAIMIFIGMIFNAPEIASTTGLSSYGNIESTHYTVVSTSSEQEEITPTPSFVPNTTTLSEASEPNSGSSMKVHFLDVGQGAAILFEIGDKVMIIDGGDRDKSSFVVSYLKKLGIEKVDVMIATHYDGDHLNGLVGVLHAFPVLQVYSANYLTDTRVFNSFKSIIQEKQIPESFPEMKQSIQVGDAEVIFVAPRNYGHSVENDDSICVRVVFGQTSFLIMGDSSADAEQQMLSQSLKSDVLFASHHGSNGSNSKTLLANVNPAFVVISCGQDNSYGHPGENTLNRISNAGAELFRTDEQGTVTCTSDGAAITWDQSPCNIFIPGEMNSQVFTHICLCWLFQSIPV